MLLGLALFFGAFTWAVLEILAGPDVGGGDGMRTFTVPTSAASGDAFTVGPCAREDDTGPCYWDGATRGNGDGRSFWIDPAGTVRTLPAGESAGVSR